MHTYCPAPTPTTSSKELSTLTLRAKLMAVLACVVAVLCSYGFGQSMSTFPGLNTVQNKINSTATPDPTIAVGTLEYCEHVNSGYQCWYKSGVNANQPVKFLGNSNVKSDSGPWSQNSNNGGNTPHCPTAYSPNSQILHDNVYNLWIMEKRITASGGGHNYMCVAISNVEDIASTSPAFAWFAFEFDLDTVIPMNSHGNFYYPDYPQAGLWQTSTTTTPPYTAATDQAMWITYDLQDVNNGDNINAVLVCAIDLAGLRASTASPWVNHSKTPACTVAHPLTTYNQRRSWVPANNTDTTPPISADGEMFTYLIEPPKDGHSFLTDPNHTQGVEQWTINWSASQSDADLRQQLGSSVDASGGRPVRMLYRRQLLRHGLRATAFYGSDRDPHRFRCGSHAAVLPLHLQGRAGKRVDFGACDSNCPKREQPDADGS